MRNNTPFPVDVEVWWGNDSKSSNDIGAGAAKELLGHPNFPATTMVVRLNNNSCPALALKLTDADIYELDSETIQNLLRRSDDVASSEGPAHDSDGPSMCDSRLEMIQRLRRLSKGESLNQLGDHRTVDISVSLAPSGHAVHLLVGEDPVPRAAAAIESQQSRESTSLVADKAFDTTTNHDEDVSTARKSTPPAQAAAEMVSQKFLHGSTCSHAGSPVF